MASAYRAVQEMGEYVRQLEDELDRLRGVIQDEIEACEFFLSSAQKFGQDEPYGMRTILSRLQHSLATDNNRATGED